MSERPFTLQNEIKFWADQMMDHMIFINTGLVEKEIKKQNLPVKLYTTSSKLAEEWKNVLSSDSNDVEEVKELADRTLNYQNEVKETQLDGHWIGWLSDSFYNHLNLELDYFVDKLYEEPFNIENELNFWLIERKTDTEATIKLLDPTERNWEAKARQSIELLEDIETEEQSEESDLVLLTLNAFTKLDKFYEQLGRNIKDATVKTNIHPLLAEHVKREGERAIKTLKWYLNP
jgi:hypothetical protein